MVMRHETQTSAGLGALPQAASRTTCDICTVLAYEAKAFANTVPLRLTGSQQQHLNIKWAPSTRCIHRVRGTRRPLQHHGARARSQ